jgi:hypothetical protein
MIFALKRRMKNVAVTCGLLVHLLAAPLAFADEDEGEIGSGPDGQGCLAKRTDLIFSDYEKKQEEWAAHYEARRPEFHRQVLEHASAISRCVERARRRDLRTNSSTTFGIQVAPDGRIAHIAVMQANHSDNLYGACLARTLCTFTLTQTAITTKEVFLFDFNMRRKPKPHEKPWSLDPSM